MTRLGRVTDPRVLDVQEGAWASLSVSVPPSWLEEGAELELSVPKKLTCARCDGGGCDACDRSGALRAPSEEALRYVKLRLPAGSKGQLRIRIVDPFSEGGIAQLLVDIRPGGLARGVRRIRDEAPPSRWVWMVAALVVGVAIALGLLLG